MNLFVIIWSQSWSSILCTSIYLEQNWPAAFFYSVKTSLVNKLTISQTFSIICSTLIIWYCLSQECFFMKVCNAGHRLMCSLRRNHPSWTKPAVLWIDLLCLLFCISALLPQQTRVRIRFFADVCTMTSLPWRPRDRLEDKLVANMHGKYWTGNYGGPHFWLSGNKFFLSNVLTFCF